MRQQGWFGVAVANNVELSYTGISKLTESIEKADRWFVRERAEVVEAPTSA